MQLARQIDWWSMFVRLAIPRRHAEAITITAVGTQNADHERAWRLDPTRVAGCEPFSEFGQLRSSWGWAALWRKMLSRIFVAFLRGRSLNPHRYSPTGR